MVPVLNPYKALLFVKCLYNAVGVEDSFACCHR